MAALRRGCRYPETYRDGIPMLRSAPTASCAMSWQTPLRASQASAAKVCTPVDPVTYSTASCTAAQTTCAASCGDRPAAASAAMEPKSSGTRVAGVSVRNSASSLRAASLRMTSQSAGAVGHVTGDTSTREEAESTSDSCGTVTSNAVTAVPQ
jgi:hypothetical protein